MSARHLLHAFSSFAVGGQQLRFCSIANALGRRYRHSIVAMDGLDGCAERLSDAVDFEIIRVAVTRNRLVSLGNMRRFGDVLGERRPDLLVTYNWGALEWALAARGRHQVPHLHVEDGGGPGDGPDVQRWRRGAFRRLTLGGSTRVVVPSPTLARVATEQWKLRPEQVQLVPNGVDCERFARPPDPALFERLLLPPQAFTVGTVAMLRPDKNLRRLIEAMALLPAVLEAHLIIVGDGPERAALEGFAKASPVAERVHFTGMLAEPERIYGWFDAFAMSSDTAQMPLALLEAMAAGLPVAATDVGEVAAMLAPDNRALVAGRRDAAGLAAQLGLLAVDATRRAALGEANRVHARANYDQERMLRGYDVLFSGGDPQ